jgi:hypothetical protein
MRYESRCYFHRYIKNKASSLYNFALKFQKIFCSGEGEMLASPNPITKPKYSVKEGHGKIQ